MAKNLGYTFENARQVALGYSSKFAFQIEQVSLYKWAYRQGFWPEISTHMPKPPKKRKWTIEAVRNASLEYHNKLEFTKAQPGAYAAAVHYGILVEICAHMQRRLLACEVADGRQCSKCTLFKTPSEFVSAKDQKSGYGSVCRACHCARTLRYAIENRAWKRSQTALRRSIRRAATPKWLTKTDISAMREFYTRAQDMSEATGQPYEVDHIIPIGGKMVCGLHVPWNLQVLPRKTNREKSNRHV